MLWNSSGISGYAIVASDGQVGTVSDFLFDDLTWMVRWLVVDTGNWLSGRKVLLPTLALGHPNSKGHQFSVRLTKQQVKDSPDIDADRPVSRQMETNIYDYYGWSPYWGTGFYMGGYGFVPSGIAVTTAPAPILHADAVDGHRSNDDPHLRSVEAITGYHVRASDGEIGHVDDFLVEDADWSIRYLVVDTKNWWPGKKILISPRTTSVIDWSDRLVNLNVDRQRVKDSPAYDASTILDRAYQHQIYDHYSDVAPEDRP